MARGAASLMRADCAMATSGIAGPEGGTKFKPVGTVWMAVMFMLIKMLRNSYIVQEEINDD